VSWLWGRHAVEETLRARARSVKELLVLTASQGDHIKDLIGLARNGGARVRYVSKHELDRIGSGHQGLAIRVTEKPTAGLAEWLAALTPEAKKSAVLVALDQIQDPHNLGAVARAASCLGGVALLVPDRHSAPVTPAAVQASAGAIEKIPVLNVGNLAQALERLKTEGFWIYGADMTGKPCWETRLNFPLVLVIGSEGSGLRTLVRECCDELVAVPQSPGGVASLNASTAAAVLLYEAARQARG
jgi:23S rRNA (guanosine2251-2'-O)-methyltransferase